MIRIVVVLCFLPVAALLGQNAKPGDPRSGKTVFDGKCAECHAAESKDVKGGPGLQGVKNGKLPSGEPATQEVILDLLNNGRDAMPNFKGTLTEQQKVDVIAYVLTL